MTKDQTLLVMLLLLLVTNVHFTTTHRTEWTPKTRQPTISVRMGKHTQHDHNAGRLLPRQAMAPTHLPWNGHLCCCLYSDEDDCCFLVGQSWLKEKRQPSKHCNCRGYSPLFFCTQSRNCQKTDIVIQCPKYARRWVYRDLGHPYSCSRWLTRHECSHFFNCIQTSNRTSTYQVCITQAITEFSGIPLVTAYESWHLYACISAMTTAWESEEEGRRS